MRAAVAPIALVALVAIALVAVDVGCAPARAPVDAAAAGLVAALAGDGAADVVDVDAALFGYARGERVTLRSGIDGNHDIVRVDVDIDGRAGRLFLRLNATKTGFALVALMPEPQSPDAAPPPRGIARYGDAWNVAEGERDAALRAGFAVAGDYIDPQVSLTDRAGLAAHIRAFHSSLPDGRVEPTSGVAVVGSAARFRWVTKAAGVGVVDGEDLVVVDGDGRVALVCGFWDKDPPPAP